MNSRLKDTMVEQKFVENIQFKKIEPEIKTIDEHKEQSDKPIDKTVDQINEQSKPSEEVGHPDMEQSERTSNFKSNEQGNLNIKKLISECSSSQTIQKIKNPVPKNSFKNQEIDIEIKPVIIFIYKNTK